MTLINSVNALSSQVLSLLAFDTSSEQGSVALWAKGKMYSLVLPMGFGADSSAACLIPQIQQLLERTALSFQDLDVIATPTGPGSFTGIRLGIATAQGLMLATKAKSFAPTTFQVAAFGAWKDNPGLAPLLVTLTTKRDSFYTQGFDERLMPFGNAAIQTEEEIQDFLQKNPRISRVGEGATLAATSLIHLYLDMVGKGSAIPEILSPYYLHNPEFTKRPRCSP
jgi:tRNA threonylcarbamoyladenosine biosynthesis protein TsaB